LKKKKPDFALELFGQIIPDRQYILAVAAPGHVKQHNPALVISPATQVKHVRSE
jgi:hypothetical protein